MIMMMVGYQYCCDGKGVCFAIIENRLRLTRVDDCEVLIVWDDPNVVIAECGEGNRLHGDITHGL